MKNYTLLIITGVFSFCSFAQKKNNVPTDKKTEKAHSAPLTMTDDKQAVVAYRVDEKINMKFGGRQTTYTVSSIDLVDKNDLGPNNTRVVTPKYVKAIPKKVVPVINKSPENPVAKTTTVIKPVKVNSSIPNGKLVYTNIKIIENYERVLEKGYKTEEMLKQAGDFRFFAGDLTVAAKWYSQLFEFCPDELDAVYFYRYAKSLESIGKTEEAKKMMVLFQSKKM